MQSLRSAVMRRAATVAFPAASAALPAPAAAVAAPLLRRSLHGAAAAASRVRGLFSVAALPSAAPCRRWLHQSALRCGGAVHDGPEEFHGGSDFLPREAVERRVKMILADVEKIDKTKLEDPNSTFRDLGLDSLDEVEVVMMLEDEFVIEIQDEVASTICSPLDAINYITQHPFASADWRDHDEHH